MDNSRCKSCGARLDGAYCSECGERKLTPELRSAGYLFHQTIKEFTDFDGKIWRTLKTLIKHPGKIDRDFADGRRNIYLKPITLFLLINLAYVIFSGLSDFYINFYSQINLQHYSGWTTPVVLEYLKDNQWTVDEYAIHYDQLVKVLARSLVILQVPFYAVFMALICYQRKLYSGDYLIFSLNYHAWVLIIFTISGIPNSLIHWFNTLALFEFQVPYLQVNIILIGKAVVMFFAMKTMFQLSWIQALWRLPFAYAAYVISHLIYRLIQLLLTMSLVEMPSN